MHFKYRTWLLHYVGCEPYGSETTDYGTGSALYVYKTQWPQTANAGLEWDPREVSIGFCSFEGTDIPAKEISRAPISLEIYSISFDVSAESSFILNADVSG